MDKSDLFSRSDDAIAQSLRLRAERLALQIQGAEARLDLRSIVLISAAERVEATARRRDNSWGTQSAHSR